MPTDITPIIDAMIRKRPESGLVLQALILAGFRNGHCTAEDAHHIPVTHPNVRGSVAKKLGKFGFQKGEVVRGTTEASHGHWLCKWELVEPVKARAFLNEITARMVGVDTEQEKQGVLL